MFTRRRFALLVLVGVLGLLIAPTAKASQLISEEKYVLASDETVDTDLYVFANEIVIEGTIEGDLIAACGVLRITGIVSGDVQAACREIIIAGESGDDVRVAGFRVALEDQATVAGDLLAAGYSVEVGPGALVSGDVRTAARQGLVQGLVEGDLYFAGSGLQIGSGSQIAGDVQAKVDAPSTAEAEYDFGRFGMPSVPSVEQGLTVSPEAIIEGTLSYEAPEKSDIPEQVASSITFTERERTVEEKEQERPLAVRWALDGIKALVSLLIVGILLLLILPRAVNAAEWAASHRPLPSAGWGCLTLILAVVGLVILAVASIAALVAVGVLRIDPLGLPVLSASVVLGSLLTFGMVLLAWAARVVVSLWIGRRLFTLASSGPSGSRWAAFLLGAIVYCILWTIPYLGWLFDFIGILIGLGGIVLGFRGTGRPPIPEPAVAEALPAA